MRNFGIQRVSFSSSRIEQIIEEIEDYIDTCKFQPLSSSKIIVNKEELEELNKKVLIKTTIIKENKIKITELEKICAEHIENIKSLEILLDKKNELYSLALKKYEDAKDTNKKLRLENQKLIEKLNATNIENNETKEKKVDKKKVENDTEQSIEKKVKRKRTNKKEGVQA